MEAEFLGRQPCPPAKRDDVLLNAQDDCRKCEAAPLGEGICPVHDEGRQPGALPGQPPGPGALHAGKSWRCKTKTEMRSPGAPYPMGGRSVRNVYTCGWLVSSVRPETANFVGENIGP